MKKVVWITGASSGIGHELALQFAKDEVDLIISGRNRQALDSLAEQCHAKVLDFDVTDKEANLAAAKSIMQDYGRVDLAFFNAGNCEYVDVKHFDSQIFERMIQSNFLSMVYGVEAVLPLLRLSTQPHLVGMSSAVAYLGLPRSEAYGASKAAIRIFFDGLRVSLAREKILVSVVYPGFVKTPLTDRNDFPMPGLISATKAAQKIIQGIHKKKLDIKVPLWFVWLTQVIALLPTF